MPPIAQVLHSTADGCRRSAHCGEVAHKAHSPPHFPSFCGEQVFVFSSGPPKWTRLTSCGKKQMGAHFTRPPSAIRQDALQAHLRAALRDAASVGGASLGGEPGQRASLGGCHPICHLHGCLEWRERVRMVRWGPALHG